MEKKIVYRVYGYYDMNISADEEIIQEIYATEDLAQKRCKELIAKWKLSGYEAEDCDNPSTDWKETETSLWAYADSCWNVEIGYRLEEVRTEMPVFPHFDC